MGKVNELEGAAYFIPKLGIQILQANLVFDDDVGCVIYGVTALALARWFNKDLYLY